MTAILFGSISTLADTSEIQRDSFNQAFAEHGLDWTWDQRGVRRPPRLQRRARPRRRLRRRPRRGRRRRRRARHQVADLPGDAALHRHLARAPASPRPSAPPRSRGSRSAWSPPRRPTTWPPWATPSPARCLRRVRRRRRPVQGQRPQARRRGLRLRPAAARRGRRRRRRHRGQPRRGRSRPRPPAYGGRVPQRQHRDPRLRRRPPRRRPSTSQDLRRLTDEPRRARLDRHRHDASASRPTRRSTTRSSTSTASSTSPTPSWPTRSARRAAASW